jgi:hypothetical protein
VRQTDMKLLYPNQEIEFSDEQVTSDTYVSMYDSIKIRDDSWIPQAMWNKNGWKSSQMIIH